MVHRHTGLAMSVHFSTQTYQNDGLAVRDKTTKCFVNGPQDHQTLRFVTFSSEDMSMTKVYTPPPCPWPWMNYRNVSLKPYARLHQIYCRKSDRSLIFALMFAGQQEGHSSRAFELRWKCLWSQHISHKTLLISATVNTNFVKIFTQLLILWLWIFDIKECFCAHPV